MPQSNSRVSVARWLQMFAGGLASVAFPAGCCLCQGLLARPDRLPLGDDCLLSFRKHFDRGSRCGQPWSNPAATADPGAVCRELNARDFAFDAARSYGIYEGNLAKAMVLLNYEQIEPLGVCFAKQLSVAFATLAEGLAADFVVPVPLYRARQ
jgi:predicted amidophosphoribosyltransferase